MKNVLTLDYDSERTGRKLYLKKTMDIKPETPKEAAEVVNKDIELLLTGLIDLIHVANDSGYINKGLLIDEIKAKLNNLKNDKSGKSADV